MCCWSVLAGAAHKKPHRVDLLQKVGSSPNLAVKLIPLPLRRRKSLIHMACPTGFVLRAHGAGVKRRLIHQLVR